MSEESILINPDEIEKQKRPRRSQNNQVEIPQDKKYFDKGATVEVRYESQGRFSLPEVVYFKDFNVNQILNFSTIKSESLLESLLIALNNNKQSDVEFDFFDATPEEFLETLVGIKQTFNTQYHNHKYICECQYDKSSNEQLISEANIDLKSVQYTSIEQIDEVFKKFIKERLESFTDTEFRDYLTSKYKNHPMQDIDSWTVDMEVNSIKFQEPIQFHNPYDGNKYTFRLTRMRDMLDAQKIVSKKYAIKYSRIEKRPPTHGVSLADEKYQKQLEIENLKEDESRELINYTKALSLIRLNDEDIQTDAEKISLYSELTRRAFFELIEFFNKIEYGINHKIETKCAYCGKTEERWLQRSLNPLELLPLDDDTIRKQGSDSKLNIHFGF